MSADEDAKAAMRLSRRIHPLLRGAGPEVQGAVLADLLSLWLAGHWPQEYRDELLTEFVKAVQHMVPVSERSLFGPKGHPGGHGGTVVPFPGRDPDAQGGA